VEVEKNGRVKLDECCLTSMLVNLHSQGCHQCMNLLAEMNSCFNRRYVGGDVQKAYRLGPGCACSLCPSGCRASPATSFQDNQLIEDG
jgi:hypothetical protein